MIFWLTAGAMTMVVIAALLAPLLRRPPSTVARGDYDLVVYRDQLAEVERDLTRGVLNQDQAEAARLEIERRMLAVAESQASDGPPVRGEDPKPKGKKRRSAKAKAKQATVAASAAPSGATPRLMAACLALLLPVAALGLYMTLGQPGMPGVPFAERQGDPENPNDLDGLANRLAQRLAAGSGEPREWVLLGRTYAELGRYGEAADASRQAIAQGVDDIETRAFFGEMLVAANNGTVVQEARTTFADVLEQDPGNARALYYAGLALAQDGRLREGLDLWVSLAEASPPGAPWETMLRRQIAEVANELGIETPQIARAAPPPANQAAPSLAPGSQAPGPSAADVEAAAEMSPEERMAFIRSMVDRLASRLEEEPEDLEGWLRLARAYAVLGETGKVEEALDRADGLVAQLPPEAPERSAVDQARQALQSITN